MALSMDEQRMLAEIERRLAAEDPGLAVRLSSFKRPSSAAKLRSPRSVIIGTVFAVAAAVVISMMVYAMVPFRAHGPQDITPSASGNTSVSGQVKPGAAGRAGHSGSGRTAAKPSSGVSAKTSSGSAGTATP
jgi:hypothetical protein